ncbi:MAG: hypothetical protein PHQ12_09430 [Chthoniobacteraceae bacterium]|nr:hypothetical protein [Chthoniobacteraceae bacterium]
MIDPEEEPLQQQLQELRREVKRTHRWVMFSSLLLAVLAFAPKVIVWIDGRVESFITWLGIEFSTILSLVAIVAVIVLAAAIVSRSSASQPRGAGNGHPGDSPRA